MWPFKKPKPPTLHVLDSAPELIPQITVAVQPPVLNPDPLDLNHAEYRANAIARDFEQRRDEGRELHVDHDAMVAEALSYAWILVRGNKWARTDVENLEKRLLGS